MHTTEDCQNVTNSAEIRTSENGKTPKSELLSVWSWACSDFRRLGLNEHDKSVQKTSEFQTQHVQNLNALS